MNTNIFTKHHEPFGFLVQSQRPGVYMILRRTDPYGGWVRLAEGFVNYVEACDAADALAAADRA